MHDEQKIRDELSIIEAEIDRQHDYCQEYVLPYVRMVAKKSLQRQPNPLWMLVHTHKGIRMSIRKYKLRGRSRKHRYRIQVNIWYKFRKVLEYHMGRDNTYSNLKVFHACDWINEFEEFLSCVKEKFVREDLKLKEKHLKGALKSMKSRCDKYKNYCKKDE